MVKDLMIDFNEFLTQLDGKDLKDAQEENH